jgi:hypothetical protein
MAKPIADGRGGEKTGTPRQLPDWEVLQEVVDGAFHRRGDAYPRGSSEHKEILVCIPLIIPYPRNMPDAYCIFRPGASATLSDSASLPTPPRLRQY